MKTPDIITEARKDGCLLRIHAYRRLTKAECEYAAQFYLRQHHMTRFKSGSIVDIITTFGLDEGM